MVTEPSPETKVDKPADAPAWHARPAEEALQALESTQDGLTEDEAAKRRERYGPNRLPQAESEAWWQRLARQFHDMLIYILLVAAVITALLGEWIDMGVILGVVVVNALIGFIQEGKAEAALAAIREMLSLQAVVLRDGERHEVDAADLVPGDVVFVESGDRIPADLRVLRVRNLQVEEAVLTGESTPVTKQVEPVAEDASMGDRTSLLFSGTTVTRGQGHGLVTATGEATEIGRIGAMIASVESISTPLLRAINRFGKILSVVILLVAALTFAFGYFFRGFALEELFLIVVGLAVAAIPEGLPAIMTITLALGVQRMARRRAILRRLPAVETLGSVTVICSDKTGTLTRNEMMAARIQTAGALYEVTGDGYVPEGQLQFDGARVDVDSDDVLRALIVSAVLASDAVLRQDEGWHIEGDPTEGAFIVLGEKSDLGRSALHKRYPRIDAIPFESENRFMAVLADSEKGPKIHAKGAPERILSMCGDQLGSEGEREPLEREAWEDRVQKLAEGGHRVLAVAMRPTDEGSTSLDMGDINEDLTFLGIVGLIDPPREEAIQSVRECQAAGIRVKMITGDHAETARAIAEQLNIGSGKPAVTGAELEVMTDEELVSIAVARDVFARTSPEHKLRLVQALQSTGAVVAMTGDGVNDAPALKRADVGVAMGIKGAEASKDASDMVLADDNFATIASAIREGRTIYDNLKKTILFLLPTNGAEALIVIATVIFAFSQLPITPVQILWVNMVTAVTLALALAFEPPEAGVMRRPPRDPDEPILSLYLLWRITFVSLIICVAALWLFFREMDLTGSDELARTVTVNVLAVGQFAYLFNSRFIRDSSLSISGILGNRYVLLAGAILFLLQLGFTYLPILNLWFGTEALPVDRWLWINGAGLSVFLLVELEKAVMRQVHPPRRHQPSGSA